MDGELNRALQLLTHMEGPVLIERYSLQKSPDHGLYERIKLTARVDDRVWYLTHRIMSALSAALCFGVVIVGGIMTSISNPNPFQYCAVILPVSIISLGSFLFLFSYESGAGLDASGQELFIILTF